MDGRCAMGRVLTSFAPSYCREPHPSRCPNWSPSQKKIHHFVVVSGSFLAKFLDDNGFVCFLSPDALPSFLTSRMLQH